VNGRQRRTHVRRSGRASASEWRRRPHTPPDRACVCPRASLGATTTGPSRAGSSAAAVRGSRERTAFRKPASRVRDGLHHVRVIGVGCGKRRGICRWITQHAGRRLTPSQQAAPVPPNRGEKRLWEAKRPRCRRGLGQRRARRRSLCPARTPRQGGGSVGAAVRGLVRGVPRRAGTALRRRRR
jgi:hypothetical protein